MFQAVQLPLNRITNSGIGVTEQVNPPGANGVEISLALEIFQPYALAAANGNQRQLLMVLHLCARMPQHRKVALNQLLVFHHGKCIGAIHQLQQGLRVGQGHIERVEDRPREPAPHKIKKRSWGKTANVRHRMREEYGARTIH